MLAESLATVCSGLFTGAAIYVTAVEHPGHRQGGTQLALTAFAPTYHRAMYLQSALAVVGGVSALRAWRAQADARWLLGGGLLVAVGPFTVLAIFPTNKQLLDPTTAQDVERAEQLLTQWGRLHAVRTILGLASFMVCVFVLGHRRD